MRTATRLSTRFQMPVNVTISNVPGPREPLYTAGAKLLHYYPVSTIVDGQGLNITVQSYLDTLDFGLVACRELVPDLWDMVDAIVEDLEGLAKAAGVPYSVISRKMHSPGHSSAASIVASTAPCGTVAVSVIL